MCEPVGNVVWKSENNFKIIISLGRGSAGGRPGNSSSAGDADLLEIYVGGGLGGFEIGRHVAYDLKGKKNRFPDRRSIAVHRRSALTYGPTIRVHRQRRDIGNNDDEDRKTYRISDRISDFCTTCAYVSIKRKCVRTESDERVFVCAQRVARIS